MINVGNITDLIEYRRFQPSTRCRFDQILLPHVVGLAEYVSMSKCSGALRRDMAAACAAPEHMLLDIIVSTGVTVAQLNRFLGSVGSSERITLGECDSKVSAAIMYVQREVPIYDSQLVRAALRREFPYAEQMSSNADWLRGVGVITADGIAALHTFTFGDRGFANAQHASLQILGMRWSLKMPELTPLNYW
jgi:hypothetical protein